MSSLLHEQHYDQHQVLTLLKRVEPTLAVKSNFIRGRYLAVAHCLPASFDGFRAHRYLYWCFGLLAVLGKRGDEEIFSDCLFLK